MTAETIAKALGGRKAGGSWITRCPAHDDREPSLSISTGDQGKVLVHCHAGCAQAAVVEALKVRGLWPGRDAHQRLYRPAPAPEPHRKANALQKARRVLMARIWQQTRPASGSLIARYLGSRGIVSPLPSDLHFHPKLRHPTGAYAPAMVAAVRNVNGDVTGLHRTWLRDDGACKARLSPAKAMLGICRGGAVWLAEVDNELGVSEGIESGLSVRQATGLPVWAALSTSGLTGLVIPARVRRIVILADGDEPGEKAAQMAAARWCLEGRSVRIARPPRGCDFNDLLLDRTPRIEEGVA
jgi:phage/plasmid primase-like uncharacterized protein